MAKNPHPHDIEVIRGLIHPNSLYNRHMASAQQGAPKNENRLRTRGAYAVAGLALLGISYLAVLDADRKLDITHLFNTPSVAANSAEQESGGIAILAEDECMRLRETLDITAPGCLLDKAGNYSPPQP